MLWKAFTKIRQTAHSKNATAIIYFLCISCLFLTGCIKSAATPENVEHYMSVVVPKGEGPFPVVIFYQGTGANSRRSRAWSAWFREQGVASAIVSNAGMRHRNTNPPGSNYSEDGAVAWDILRSDPRIDTDHFALMGFSRGGQQALNAGSLFREERVEPDFVFALYPGGWGRNNCRDSHGSKTEVHFFFGDMDDVCKSDHNDSACKLIADQRDDVFFHRIENATHAYDDVMGYHFTCCSPSVEVKVVPNLDAVDATRKIIKQAIDRRWKR